MPRLNSFRDVIEDRFYNEIFNALSTIVEDNPGKLDSKSYCVLDPDEATLSNAEVKLVNITDSEGNGILFDVVVSAEIEVAETVMRNRETDSLEQWFRISCSAELEDGFQKFYISDIHIYSKYKDNGKNNLSEYLVPIIYKAQLDDVAETFLKKYYPEALAEPMVVPPREIAKRMGLNVQEVHITKTCTVFGQVYFSDCEMHYYDSDTRAYKPLAVERGTILVDPSVYFMRNVGSMNNPRHFVVATCWQFWATTMIGITKQYFCRFGSLCITFYNARLSLSEAFVTDGDSQRPILSAGS